MCCLSKTTLYWCRCFRLKCAIIIIGCWESILFLAIMGVLIFHSIYFPAKLTPKLGTCNIIPYYVWPFVSILPPVIAFYYLAYREFQLSARQLYRYARLFCLLTGVLCILLQIANVVYAAFVLEVWVGGNA